MAEYCIYTLRDCNTIASTPKDIECASDKEAIEEAYALLDGHDVEVWQGARVVIRLKPLGDTCEDRSGSALGATNVVGANELPR
jgi:hypothetical protein